MLLRQVKIGEKALFVLNSCFFGITTQLYEIRAAPGKTLIQLRLQDISKYLLTL